MAEVKFFNSAKYGGVRYPAHTPFQVVDADVGALVAKGAIVTVPPKPVEEPKQVVETEEIDGAKSVNQMTVAELKAYAQSNEIDISGAERKAEILAAIKRT